jgi:hypothetical protein
MVFQKPKSIEKSCYIYKDIWSDKNEIEPQNVSVGSSKKILFNCLKCSHEYFQSPNKKILGRGCHYCSNKLRCGKCKSCLEKSCFIYKDIWSDKNKEDCKEVAISCHKKYWFNCEVCGHEYKQCPHSKKSGSGCPYCANIKRCGKCEYCLENSCFRYKNIWSDKNKEYCEEVALYCHKKYLFNCLICKNTYIQSPSDKSSGNQCSLCVNKTELKVLNFLKEQKINVKRQYKIKDIKKYYDFYLPDFALIIEIDGDQHFRQVSNWGCHEEAMKNDIQKMQTGMEDSISFLRIYQPDIYSGKIDWKTIILKNLYKRTLPDITYISSNSNIYDKHNFFSKCIV